MPAAKFITDRHISKITRPGKWNDPTEFSFTICNNVEKLNEALEVLSGAFAIAIDIETLRVHASISCVGYTGGFVDSSGVIRTRSFVIPFTSTFNLQYVRKINALPVAKIFQNGKYDNAYFLRFNAPVTNWIWDTAHLFHSWYSELPKDLGFLNSFFLRKVQYWKDLAKSGDKYLYYKYNALDTWATFNVWMIQMAQMPAWARKNYTLEFPLVFPCLLSEMTGVRRDSSALSLAHKKETEQLNRLQGSLNRILGVAYFNTNSGKHMAALFKVLGLGSLAVKYTPDGDKDSYDEKIINRARLAHPFGGRILDLILEIRGIRKNISTYLTTGEEAKEFYKFRRIDGSASGTPVLEDDGRILYALNPHGTDTGRLSSNEHQFWCGLNFQTAPRSGSYKTTIGADKGFRFAEVDLKQAESRDTANISGDKNLISALDSDNDFHAFNAAAFFGVPYDSIYQNGSGSGALATLGKTINKALRDLAKRVNHGANYNMGEAVLVETMGLEKIYEARRLLGLPMNWNPIQVAGYLLASFHKTYPGIAQTYYPWVIKSVKETSMLVSRAVHHVDRITSHFGSSLWSDNLQYLQQEIDEGDWTRYCFGRPDKNKRDLNALVAHCPQSLNARTLNEAYLKVFYEVALLNPEFRLHAQIHDSIFFSFMEGKHAFYTEAVRVRMEIPVTIKSCDGEYRTFTVPADIKAGKDGKGAKFWHLTE